MAEALARESMHRVAAAYGLTNKPIVEKPAPIEYVSHDERRTFNKLFCNKDKQSTERTDNIRTASAQYALETVSDPNHRFALAILAIDTHEELEKLSNDLTDGRVSNLRKSDYDKFVGPYERAVTEVESKSTESVESTSVNDSLLSPEELEFMQGVEKVLEEANAPLEHSERPLYEQDSIFDTTTRKAQSRKIGGIATWLRRHHA